MTKHKKELLKRHRLHRRLLMLTYLALAITASVLTVWWVAPSLLMLAWIGHEAWFSDHLFYSSTDDHQNLLCSDWTCQLALGQGCLRADVTIPKADTLILKLRVSARPSGYFLDPYIVIDGERFDFERGARGQRYLSLTKTIAKRDAGQWSFESRHCTVKGPIELTGFDNPDFAGQRVMVIAPHADDAELAAFGLYQQAREVMIVTLTQGEIEAENYQPLGLDSASAAQLKGRLRSWDSIAVPLWGKVPAANCLQLGYYCMQLPEMKTSPGLPFGSRQSARSDIREARVWNQRALPADGDGLPTWKNLVSDLTALFDHFDPQVIVTPHPERDPHPDHVAASQAVQEALVNSKSRAPTFLLYANHLHNNDRWPMGPAGGGITLPPSFTQTRPERYWSLPISPTIQLDKAMALAMQHDLQAPLPFKKRLRRTIQRLLAGRTWPATGNNEYFRKAVRSCELFTVRQDLN